MEVLCRDPVPGNNALSWLINTTLVDRIDGTIGQVFIALPYLRAQMLCPDLFRANLFREHELYSNNTSCNRELDRLWF
jgi:hypothetical protein